MDDLKPILELIAQFGTGGVFLWMLIREMNKHDETREQYRDDLRDVAGMRQQLRPLSDTQPIPNIPSPDKLLGD